MHTLLHAAEHHAKDKADLIREISFAFTTVLRPAGWEVKCVKGGAGSWMIFHPVTGKEFHFRNGGNGMIDVKDAYYNGKWVVTFKSRMDVWRWARTLVP